MQGVVVKVGHPDPAEAIKRGIATEAVTRRDLSAREIEKRAESQRQEIADADERRRRRLLLATVADREYAQAVAASPDPVLLCRLGIARRLLEDGRDVPDALLQAIQGK